MNLSFEVNDRKDEVQVMDGEKHIGTIFTPSSSGMNNMNCIQICGFSEAFELWGCGRFKGFKDIQLLFDGVKLPGEGYENYHTQKYICQRCFRKPCACEVKEQLPDNNPFTLKREYQLLGRIVKKDPTEKEHYELNAKSTYRDANGVSK